MSTVRIAHEGGDVQVEARDQTEHFAATPDMSWPARKGRPWAVTHVGTGLAVAGPVDVRTARHLMRLLEEAGFDWDFTADDGVYQHLDERQRVWVRDMSHNAEEGLPLVPWARYASGLPVEQEESFRGSEG